MNWDYGGNSGMNMKKWNMPAFCLLLILCLGINYFGSMLAAALGLPVWLDSIGTVLVAYMCGPFIGAITGLTTNLLFYMIIGHNWIYAIVSIWIALIVGLMSMKKKRRMSLFEAMTLGGVVALGCTAIATPLNLLLNSGSTGNIWGDSMVSFLLESGLPRTLAVVVGQLYVELLDKVIVVLLIYLAAFLVMRRRRKKEERLAAAQSQEDGAEEIPTFQPGADADTLADNAQKAAKTLAVLLAAGLCLGSLSWEPAQAQEADASETSYTDYVQTIYSSQNGLPCGEANDIAQTIDGILWIGTYAGLYRYNGRDFLWMDSYDSVRNVNCLYVDEEGRLWIGTNDNGLSIVINEEVANVIDVSDGLPSDSVRSIIRSSDGYYYIGTTDSMQVLTLNNGLRRVNTLTEIFYADRSSADEQGHVAAVTNQGVLYLLEKGRVLSSRQITDGKSVFKSCYFNQQGQLLAATTGNEIYVFDISKGWFEKERVISTGDLSSIKDMLELDSGELLVTADNGIGYIRSDGKLVLFNTGGFNNSIDHVLVDYQGNMWFTSSRLGLLRMAPSDFKDIYSMTGLENHVVNTIMQWQGLYYIGTDKGLDVVDLNEQTAISNDLTKQLEGIRIRCMITDSEDHLWICTYGSGLLEIEPDGTQYVYDTTHGGFGNRARVVKQLSDGTIVAAGDTDLVFIRDHEIEQTVQYEEGQISSMILTLTELADGRLLAGTDGNGIAVLENEKVSRMLTREDGLSSEVILRTVADPDGDGVFVVTSNGLCYMENDETIRPLDNFPYFNNYDIWIRETDQGADMLYVMSSAGIYVVNREELLSGVDDLNYELLDTRKGLNSSLTANSWTYLDERTRELFLPCDTGVFVLDTDKMDTEKKTYRMSVPMARLDGVYQRVERNVPIRVARGSSKLELFPEIMNYTIQDPYVGYKLEGFDEGWTILSQDDLGIITYTNLPTGEYIFRLAVFDNSQTSILTERTYRLVKERELHDNPWFIAYLLLIPMLTVGWVTWLLVHRRERRIQRELDQANRQVEMGRQTVIAVARAVDAKDPRTGGHSQRVAQYSKLIAKAYGLDDNGCREIEWAASLHDIGKIGIPDNILNKDSRLTDEEYAIMKSHTTKGAEILKDFTLLDHVSEGAEFHHERPDGRGYPKGLKGDEIPLFARMIGVADAFDAMTANRVYRKQMDVGYVLGELEKGRGTQFDEQFVDILLDLLRSGEIDLEKLYGITPEEAGLDKARSKPEESGPKEKESGEEASTGDLGKKGGAAQ